MKTIIDKNTGQEIGAVAIDYIPQDNEILIDELRTDEMQNPYFDLDTRIFYDKQ
jgi:hypothetical protein